MFVAYVVSGVYAISNNSADTNGTLIMKGGIIHIVTFLSFILLTFLFGIVLSYPIEMTSNVKWTISTHIILNFFFFIEMCKFFKYPHGIKLYPTNKCTRGPFICTYDQEELEENPDHEHYYLAKDTNKYSSWYFGKGLTGRIRIFLTYFASPFIFQALGFLSHVKYDNEELYVILISMSYALLIMQTIFKTVMFAIFCTIGRIFNECFQCWTVETEPGQITNENITPVVATAV